MRGQFHLSDQELLMDLDGELSPRETAQARVHLDSCWECRTRRAEAENAIAAFMHFQRSSVETQSASPDGPRALLRARLAELTTNSSVRARFLEPRWMRFALLVALMVGASLAIVNMLSRQFRADDLAVTVPNPRITPGATVLFSQTEVCQAVGEKNKIVPASLRQRVFAEYGIRHANPEAYEVDYLITPALGGADDIHNLWPESNRSAVWNSQVKDALEDRLHDLVCAGEVDLETAQREIAGNWILAYKKYFHTNLPLTDKSR